MLQKDKLYLIKFIFDDFNFVLPIVSGPDPRFKFSQKIEKKFKYEELEKKYMEIIIYCLPSTIDLYKMGGSIDELIKKADIYSAYKISLLTIVVGPEFHNIALISQNKNNHVGRIMYTITCKQISNINIKINSVKLILNNLLNNDIALKLKYHNNDINPNTTYTNSISPNILQKEKITEYKYKPELGENNPLNINIKTSMYDLTLADSSLNAYLIRLINKPEEVKDSIFQNELNIRNKNNDDLKSMNHYTMIGFSILSFLEILSENDEALNKQSSQFFRHVSGFNMPREGDKEEGNAQVFTFEVFQNLNREYNTPLYYEGVEIGKCEINIDIRNVPLIRQIMCGVMTENGFEINSIHLYDNILSGEGSTLPSEVTLLINYKRNFNNELIKQKQLTSETGFNFTIFQYLKDFKNVLNKTIEDDCLYYGYSEYKDLFTGQNVILDLGLILIKIIDKLTKDQRNISYDILSLINDRSEFDLGTLSTKWFVEKNIRDGIKQNKYTFMDESLLKNKTIENFLDFNLSCLKLSLDIINREKMLDIQGLQFAENYLRIAYFRIPLFRQILLNYISSDVTEKIGDLLKKGSNYKNMKKRATIADNYLENDPINSLLLWEELFYNKLNYSLEDNEKNWKIENEIKEKIIKTKEYIETMNKNEELKNDWKSSFKSRDNLFFDLIKNLVNFIKSKAEANNDINWLNIVGFDILLNSIVHEIHSRPVKLFPPKFKDIFKLFINNSEIINSLINEIAIKTNLYDVQGIFNLIDIINDVYKDEYFLKFNYVMLNQIDKFIFKVDHSLCVAKLILFYYNCAHLMSIFHLGEIMQTIFFSKFYNLFFHWSYEVRDKFYYLILFIIGYRIKEFVPFKDLEDLKYIKKTNLVINIHKNLGDILKNKFNLIKEIQNIIKTQNYDINFNNVIDPIKYANILKEIPNDVHKNIVVSLAHYDKIYNEYKIFYEINKNKKKNSIIYPDLSLVLPKDD